MVQRELKTIFSGFD